MISDAHQNIVGGWQKKVISMDRTNNDARILENVILGPRLKYYIWELQIECLIIIRALKL